MVGEPRLIAPTTPARRVAAGTTQDKTMTRDEQELAVAVAVAVAVGVAMALWRETYEAYRLIASEGREAEADAAVEAFRKRYLPQTSAPPAAWYDEPPFEKDGDIYYCWVEGSTVPQSIYWSGDSGAWMYFCDRTPVYPLNGRRVSPITKPPEPTP